MKSSSDARKDRLAAALRENLKRRKAQGRAKTGAKAPVRPDADKKTHLT
jgi:hypothetical protein